MAIPTPNGPTIADLQFAAYNQGSLNTTNFIPPLLIGVQDAIATTESVTLNVVGLTYNLSTEDFVRVSEPLQLSLDPPGPNTYSINVSDTTVTSEVVVA